MLVSCEALAAFHAIGADLGTLLIHCVPMEVVGCVMDPLLLLGSTTTRSGLVNLVVGKAPLYDEFPHGSEKDDMDPTNLAELPFWHQLKHPLVVENVICVMPI